eukprot:1646840-Rhodomonas_salina.2
MIPPMPPVQSEIRGCHSATGEERKGQEEEEGGKGSALPTRMAESSSKWEADLALYPGGEADLSFASLASAALSLIWVDAHAAPVPVPTRGSIFSTPSPPSPVPPPPPKYFLLLRTLTPFRICTLLIVAELSERQTASQSRSERSIRDPQNLRGPSS